MDLYEATFFGENVAPNEISLTMPSLVEISTLTIDDIFDMFPSSNEFGVRMCFLNQSTYPSGRKSFDSNVKCHDLVYQ